jgi:hypothetical protein
MSMCDGLVVVSTTTGSLPLRANEQGGEERIVGDNTGASGTHWTKATDLGLDLLSTLVARETGLATERERVNMCSTLLATLPARPTGRCRAEAEVKCVASQAVAGQGGAPW